ncbi:hypothetical protein L6452_36756 [Arctium lappa]|uniref:Uncharacterized protein n=1 Tax=Arctium lappa TaxID=4217 RepID=A0ACB8Y137_ARCLA|nr:hypothetical protein L6452_36756 [Arctium lappa]
MVGWSVLLVQTTTAEDFAKYQIYVPTYNVNSVSCSLNACNLGQLLLYFFTELIKKLDAGRGEEFGQMVAELVHLKEDIRRHDKARRKSARIVVRTSFSNFKNTTENPVDVDAEAMQMEEKKDADVNIRVKIKIPSRDVKPKQVPGIKPTDP